MINNNDNNTRLSHGTISLGHGYSHGIRSSIASALRRKGSALVSLSTLFRGSRPNQHQHPTNSHTWTTDPSEDRPSFYHLEHTCSPPYGSWSDRRKQAYHHRKRQFWTVSGTRSRARSSSTNSEYTHRISRARSFVQSLRKRGSLIQEDYTLPGEGSSDNLSEEVAPTLDMPSGCATDMEPPSSFWLGVQKAVQGTTGNKWIKLVNEDANLPVYRYS